MNKYNKVHQGAKERERRRRQIETGQLTPANGLRVIRFDGSHSFDRQAHNAQYYQDNRDKILARMNQRYQDRKREKETSE